MCAISLFNCDYSFIIFIIMHASAFYGGIWKKNVFDCIK